MSPKLRLGDIFTQRSGNNTDVNSLYWIWYVYKCASLPSTVFSFHYLYIWLHICSWLIPYYLYRSHAYTLPRVLLEFVLFSFFNFLCSVLSTIICVLPFSFCYYMCVLLRCTTSWYLRFNDALTISRWHTGNTYKVLNM